MSKQETSVQEVEINLDTLGIDMDTIITQTEDKPKENNMFSNNKVDLSFIDNNELDEVDEKIENKIEEIDSKEVDEILSTEEDPTKGRHKISKDGVVELTNKLIEKGLLVPFEDDKPIDKYTLSDFEELIEANFKEKEEKFKESLPSEFFESLPNQLQIAAKYVADGGKDLKGLFRTLAGIEEVNDLDVKSPEDQEIIIRSYLQATNFGSLEEINEEIDSWKDRNELESKAQKFKPKLDAMQEKIVASKLEQQERQRKQREKESKEYQDTIYNVLEPGEINGLKLDKKTQSLLYSGLVQPAYTSITGKQTNLLGHLLEKYQFVEPNPSLIAETLWLLSDAEGYKAKVREIEKKETTKEHVRMLKTEQSNKKSSASEPEETIEQKRQGIKRANTSFFKR